MWRWLGMFLSLAIAADASEFRRLEGHGGPVMAVDVSPDGHFALTGSFDNAVGFWDVSGDEVVWLDGHQAAVKAVRFLDKGLAASGGDDFAVEIWSLKEGGRKHRLEGHQGQVSALAHWGDVLASASWDGTVRLWRISDGASLAVLDGHRGSVNDVVFLDGGDALLSASSDGTIRRWRVADGTQTRVLVRHGFAVNRLVMNEAAGWLAYGAVDGGTRVIDLATDEVLADLTLERRPILAMDLSADARHLAVGDGEGWIMVVRTENWSVETDFHAALKGPIWALAYTGNGSGLLAGGIEDAAYIWPMDNTRYAPRMATDARTFQISPDAVGNGERQFLRKCSVCHDLTDDGKRRAGPTLAGLFGRRAGTVPGYVYSDAVANSGVVWEADTIDLLFDRGPAHYLPGTKMPMQRITSPDDRRDLIDYLRANTGG